MLAYAGKGRLVIQAIDLSETIVRTAKLISASIPKSVELKFALDERLPIIQSDPGQIQQVVMNLIINAAEAADQNGGGQVIVRARAEEVAPVEGRSDVFGNSLFPGLYAVFEVQDTGCGMDAATLAKIFDPFFTTKFTGRGLGLAAVSGVVRSHRGGIEVKTEVGKGSTFRVLLPASYAQALMETPTDAGEPATAGMETVLLIDDEEVVRSVAESALLESGYRPIVAEGGEQGLEYIRSRSDISLVLLDMNMPGMSGRDVLEQLKEQRPALPVIVCSGYSDMEVSSEFSGLEIAGILEKPFTAEGLAAKVRLVLDTACVEAKRKG
jgi:CheY-like chemotaxis protein